MIARVLACVHAPDVLARHDILERETAICSLWTHIYAHVYTRVHEHVHTHVDTHVHTHTYSFVSTRATSEQSSVLFVDLAAEYACHH